MNLLICVGSSFINEKILPLTEAVLFFNFGNATEKEISEKLLRVPGDKGKAVVTQPEYMSAYALSISDYIRHCSCWDSSIHLVKVFLELPASNSGGHPHPLPPSPTKYSWC